MTRHDAASPAQGKQNPERPTLFRDFMRDALYHPAKGYYTAQAATPGRRGDFSTAATLFPAVAAAVARWLLRSRPALGPGLTWHIIEPGAGSGLMARDILKSLGWLHRLSARYHIVEISPTYREAQKKTLAGFPVRWHKDMAAALEACGGRALIFSHELVDAFPCDLLEFRGGSWHAIALAAARDSWAETSCPLADTGLQESDSAAMQDPAARVEGQRIEVFASYEKWLAGWVPRWRRGRMLTVDYGGTTGQIIHRKPAGTLRAYWHHQLFEGPEVYARQGKQDITADVNFDDLRAWGARLGLTATPLLTLDEFLQREGLSIPDPRFAAGAGEAFKTLEQFPSHTSAG